MNQPIGQGHNAFSREVAAAATNETTSETSYADPASIRSGYFHWRLFEEYFWWVLCFVALAILAWRRLL